MSTTTSHRLELVTPDGWRAFVAAPAAVLVLGRATCAPCAAWSEALPVWLAAEPARWARVRFGKLLLDQGGLIDFKRANPWLAGAAVLPINLLYRDGTLVERVVGGDADRLDAVLGRAFGAPG